MVNNRTHTSMVYGERGQFPINIKINSRLLNFLGKLLTGKESKLSCIMYKLLYQLYVKNILESPSITHVKYILNSIGLSKVWLNKKIVNIKWFKAVVKLKLTDQYHQQWGSNICNSNGCTTYRIIKYDFKMEIYLLVLPPNLSRPLCKFFTCNHQLPIQQDRYGGIDRQEILYSV